ncbi:tetratricopeptide repeat protein [Mucilaginibacter hurinus]|nr:tetratricopeptide repeat protein [Mucilaginibacter hurinus]
MKSIFNILCIIVSPICKQTRAILLFFVWVLLCNPFYASAQSPEAQKLYAAGKTQYDSLEFDRAIISLTSAINLHPQYADAYSLRGNAYYRKKEYDIAIADYKESLKLRPDVAAVYYNMGDAYLLKGQNADAIKMFKEAVRSGPQDINNYNGLLRAYSTTDNMAALDMCNEIIRRFPGVSSGYSSRAAMYVTMNQYDKGIKDYEVAIGMEPNNAYLYQNRGIAYRKHKKYDQAISDFNQALRLMPDQWQWHAYKAYIYADKGSKDLAIASINEALRIKPEWQTYLRRAAFYESIKENTLALKDYETAIALNPGNPYQYSARGEYYRRKRQYDAALADINKSIELDKSKTEYYGVRGNLYREWGEYEKSVADYKTDLANNPVYSTSSISIVPALVRLGRFDEAKAYAAKVSAYLTNWLKESDWRFYRHYLQVISSDLPVKNYTTALQNLDFAINDYKQFGAGNEEAFTEYVDVLVLKAYVLSALSRNKEAKELYEQTLLMLPTQPDVKAAIAHIGHTDRVLDDSDKLPPVIQLISPQAARGLKIVSANTKVEIIGRANDPSGIATVTINNSPVEQIEEDGLFISSVMLKQGLNNVVIGAIDKKGNIASRTFSLDATPKQEAEAKEAEIILPATEKPPVYHAILIAANDYEDPAIDDLENPLKDASELEAILKTGYTFSPENITTLFNKSREEIMQALVLKSSALTDNDNLLIFYAGHGIAEKDKFGDVDGYWVPSSAKKGLNASYISADDINKALKRSNSRHILVIADACFSGAFTRALVTDASLGIQKQFAVPSRKIMASGNLEPVPDNSRFVYYLKKNLKENTEKYMTAKKLFDSFYEAILNNSETSPQYTAIKNVGDEGGQFVFIKKQ